MYRNSNSRANCALQRRGGSNKGPFVAFCLDPFLRLDFDQLKLHDFDCWWMKRTREGRGGEGGGEELLARSTFIPSSNTLTIKLINISRQLSSISHQPSNIKYQISNMKYHITYKVSNIKISIKHQRTRITVQRHVQFKKTIAHSTELGTF